MLKGIRVVEMAPLFPGPYAGRILLDMGAKVLKVQPPVSRSGDLLHVTAHRFEHTPPEKRNEMDAPYFEMFQSLNKGKEMVECDLMDEARCQWLVDTHIKNADILLTGYRPGMLEKVGLSPIKLRKLFPNLVICMVSGYGAAPGPLQLHAGHDLNYLARNGVLAMQLPRVSTSEDAEGSATGTTATAAASGPAMSPLPVQVADVAGGSFPAVINILGGLLHVQRNSGRNDSSCSLDGFPGPGGVYDISMADCSQSLLVLSQAASKATDGLLDFTHGSFYLCGSAPCYNVYMTKDKKFMAVGALEPPYWKRAVQALGLDVKYFTNPKVQMGMGLDEKELQSVFQKLSATFLAKTRDEWTAVFATLDAMVDPVLTPEEALTSPHAKSRRSAVQTTWNHDQSKIAHELVPSTIVSLRRNLKDVEKKSKL